MSEGQQVPRPEDGEIITLSKSDFESLHAEVGYLYIERSLAKKQNEAYIKSISRENAELISRLENSAELLEKSAEEIEALKAYITKLERRAEKASDYIHSLEEKAGIKRELKEEPQSTPAEPDIQDPPPPTNTGDLEFSHTKLTDELNSDIDVKDKFEILKTHFEANPDEELVEVPAEKVSKGKREWEIRKRPPRPDNTRDGEEVKKIKKKKG